VDASQDKSTEWGWGAMPLPVMVTVAGEFVALLTNATLPFEGPLSWGVNPTVATFVPPAAIVIGKVMPLRL
jgi:hypothetical protein